MNLDEDGYLVNSYDIELDDDEHVIDMTINSGWMIDSLTFEIGRLRGSDLLTRKVGPFGGNGGRRSAPKPSIITKAK